MDTIEELAKDLVGVSEIANRAGVQANTVAVWTQRHDNFPDPIVQIGGRVRVWWWPDVEEWITTGRKKEKRTPTKAGPRLRFHILKRDGFRCRYCGRNSTDVELQVDHLNPVSNGETPTRTT